MTSSNYSASEYIQHAEEEISLLGEKAIKALLDNNYDPLKVIEIFSEFFDNDQVRDLVSLQVGDKLLLVLKNIKELSAIEKETRQPYSVRLRSCFFIYILNLPNSNQQAQIDFQQLKLCLSFLHPFGGVHVQFPFFARYHASDLCHEHS